jgi:predicted adenine nucleotide alpha hydrolase (AANH) superfamily ATPase
MKKKLLLHACCAPCLTGAYDQLKNDYDITLFWFNPNISPVDEYIKRLEELKRYAKILGNRLVIVDRYAEDNFYWNNLTKNYSKDPEGGKRCEMCIKYRLLNTTKYASENHFDYFATTLSVSPHKNSDLINTAGRNIAGKFDSIQFLDKDFEDANSFKKSLAICREFNIYRQKYCGCRYSAR